jgi:ribose 5-phosphate isomerase B
MKVYLASDHAGFELKKILVDFLKAESFEVEDCGPLVYDAADDYPPLIAAGASKLSADAAAGIDSKAIVLGASGQGEAMVANRFPHVRCAVYYGAPQGEQVDMSGKSLSMIQSTRAHNNANCLSLGARFLDIETAKKVTLEWLRESFTNESRHERRINAIESVR